MQIDPTDYESAVKQAEAVVQQDQETLANLRREAARRRNLSGLAIAVEEQQSADTAVLVAQATLQQAQARLEQAQVNLERTQIRSPANGWVTNLQTQLGDYADMGATQLAVVDADSYWVNGYFEETSLHAIHVGDAAKVRLLGDAPVISGHVASIARAIDVPNEQPNQQGVATVNPIFTWVRLAQRVPVRIRLDHVPPGIQLVAAMTATVEIEKKAGAF
jgi:multidrug resistance efflux pump